MRRINHATALVAIGCAFSTPAVGQNDCLASFKINPSKSLTYVSIGPTASDRIDATMSCSIAGKMRNEFFFVTGKTIDPNMLSNANQFRAKILEIKMRLANGKSRLEQATAEAAHFSAVLHLKDTVLAAGVASATTGCILSEETCKPAVRASIARYEVANSADQVRNLTQARAQAQREISALDSMLQSIQAQISDSIIQESKRRFYVVLSEICRAIEQQCR
jgi:hypothetical protein